MSFFELIVCPTSADLVMPNGYPLIVCVVLILKLRDERWIWSVIKNEIVVIFQ